ncbi:MAG: MoaD/ThiS family protein [Solirubrobacteraceae bacterium]|nr:MoaD/ThiS family protein [Solirubrobacteraceae bacterium]
MATIKVKVPTQLRDATGGEGAVTVDGDTVGAALDALFTAHPELRGRIADEDGALRRFVNVYLDGEDIRFGDGVDTPLSDRQELQILPAVAGGAR